MSMWEMDGLSLIQMILKSACEYSIEPPGFIGME